MSFDDIFSSPDDIKELIQNNYRRLQELRKKEALMGFSVDPAVTIEIEAIKEKINNLQTKLSLLENSGVGFPQSLSKLVSDINQKYRVQILLSDNFSAFSANRQTEAIKALADTLGISPQSIEVYRIYEIQPGQQEVTQHIVETKNIEEIPVRQIPIFTGFDIEPGSSPDYNELISPKKAQDYISLSESEYEKSDFGLIMVEDGMKGDGILPRDTVLIHQQPNVKQGDIAVIVVTTPQASFVVLRRYYVVYENRKDLVHWLLEASNPTSKNLVVMPSEVDINAIQELYAGQIRAGRVQLYTDAELSITGKYVGLVKRNSNIKPYFSS